MKEMSRELEYYYKNREKISKKRKTKEFAEKRRKYQSEHNKTCRRSRKILIEIEEWLKEEIDDFKQDGYDNSEKRKDSLWLAGVYDQDKRILDKIQELKEKYK